MKLKAQPLTAQDFAPFGEIVTLPQHRQPTGSLEGLDFWADLVPLQNIGAPYGVGYATLDKRPFVQTCAERHMQTQELLHAIGGDMIVVVGPPDYPDEPNRLPPMESFRAFRVPAGDTVIMKPGVWHWAPFAAGGPMRLLVIYKANTGQTDVGYADFPPGKVLEIEP